MSEQELLKDLAKRGLRAWQADFVARFLSADPGSFEQQQWGGKSFSARQAFHLLAAPTGTGKMFAAVVAVSELAARGAKRILILAPAPVCEVWRTRITEAQTQLPAAVVNRRVYREMVAAVPVGSSPWAASGIFVMSQDFAKQIDVAESLSTVKWDLVAVDEAHRFVAEQRSALLDMLESEDAIQRLLLLTATPLPAIERWIDPHPGQPAPLWAPPVITNWYGVLKNWDGSAVERPRLDWNTVRYSRGPDEIRFIERLREAAAALVAGGGNPSLKQLLNSRAASSTFAAELSLQRLHHTLRSSVANIGASSSTDSGLDGDDEDVELERRTAGSLQNTSAALSAVEQCVDALEYVKTDEKLIALKELIRSITAAALGQLVRICIVSKYADTVSYLSSALHDSGTTVFKLTGRDGIADRTATVEQFRVGGLLVATDGGISEGLELGDIPHVVHYDLPLSPAAVEQRRGRFDRYGRTGPLSMYLLVDDSGAIPSEVAALLIGLPT